MISLKKIEGRFSSNKRSREIKRVLGSVLMITFNLCIFPRLVHAETESETEIKVLKQQLQQQQETIQQLMGRVADLEAKLEGKPESVPPPASEAPSRVTLEETDLPRLPAEGAPKDRAFPVLEWGGYIDVGYVDAEKAGSAASNAIGINSRFDSLASAGLNGKSTFLVNEVNLDLNAHVTPNADANVNFAILPRDLQVTTSSGGTASTDTVELNEAYLVYAPDLSENALNDILFGDLRISIGKFESPMGIEYRLNKSPDRINISRSHIARYTTGYPVGLRARADLFAEQLKQFRNSVFTYNFVVANSSPNISRFFDGDRADNSQRTFMGRLSYGLDAFGGFFELGTSFLYGGRVGQARKDVISEWYNGDVRFERGPWNIRAEFDYEDDGRPLVGNDFFFKGIYVESFYVLNRPAWLPKWMPMVNLAPYYRYDTRYQLLTSNTGAGTLTELDRHTIAVRYIPWGENILKFEYQINNDLRSATVEDNLFLASFVREF